MLSAQESGTPMDKQIALLAGVVLVAGALLAIASSVPANVPALLILIGLALLFWALAKHADSAR
jgi:hypothetical protein